MSDIKIVEYDPKYAEKVAVMWNESSELWLVSDKGKSKESVLATESNSDHIKLYLALYEERVVGYCKLSKYKFDENSLYINLLNVVPDFLNKKVGKILLKKTLEYSFTQKWDRVDLFTWPGNTKAVPLYKKCGFFWEKHDAYTHLMNFLPYLFNNAFTKDKLENFDWYNDLKREIQIEEDGILERNFETYEYIWDNEKDFLRTKFSKRGRGLIELETKDFIIKTEIENPSLIFGESYKIKYIIENFSKNPLIISMNGKNDKNILFDAEINCEIASQKIIEKEFFIDFIKETQNINKTHPAVISDFTINGKNVLFKTGIDPIFPFEAEFILENDNVQLNKNSKGFLLITNNFDESKKFKANLFENENLKFDKNIIEDTLETKERKKYSVDFSLLKSHIYYENVEFSFENKKREKYIFNNKISTPISSIFDTVYGETKDFFIIKNGKRILKLLKNMANRVEISYEYNIHNYYSFMLLNPKLGKPYSDEFSSKKPNNVIFEKHDNFIKMKENYISDAFSNTTLSRVYDFYSNGYLEIYGEIKSNSDFDTMFFSNEIIFDPYNLIFQTDDREVKLAEYHEQEMQNVSSEFFKDNSLFIKKYEANFGILWDKDIEMKSQGFSYFIESELKIEKNNTFQTGKIKFFINNVNSYKEFKYINNLENKIQTSSLEISINNNNPIIYNDSINLKLSEKRNKTISGILKIDSLGENYDIDLEETTESTFDLPLKSITKIKSKLENSIYSFEKTQFLLKSSGKIEAANNAIDNGVIAFSHGNHPGISSLKYKGRDILDIKNKDEKTREWLNPWLGGMYISFDNFKITTLLKEQITESYIKLRDNFNNCWEGVRVSFKVSNIKKLKNTILNNYFLTIPGTPIITFFSKLENSDGYFSSNRLKTEMFFKTCENFENMYASLGSHILKPSPTPYLNSNLKELTIKNNENSNQVIFYTQNNYDNNLIAAKKLMYFFFSEKAELNKYTQAKFLLISEENIKIKDLEILNNIKFD